MKEITQQIINLPVEKRKLLLEKLKKSRHGGDEKKIKPREDQTNIVPLSYTQERLWFLEQLDPGNTAYNFLFAERFEGSLNPQALEKTLNEIIKRHEILRTSFKMIDGQPVQFIEKTIDLKLPVIDLSNFSESEKDKEVERYIDELGQTVFDLSQAPLLKVCLLRRKEDLHLLLVCIHHIITDGWSMEIFAKELTTIYEAFVAGNPYVLPQLPVQYADYTVWQREWLKEEAQNKLLSYWKKQLNNAPTHLELPTDRPRPSNQTFHGDVYSIFLSENLSYQLKKISKEEGVTLFMTMLAAFKILLARYTGNEDIVVGTPVANRDRSEIENLIGFFVNTLVLRTNLSGHPSFHELLSRVRKVVLEAYEHRELPFEKLVTEIQPERDLSITPLFQVMFIFNSPKVKSSDSKSLSIGTPLPLSNKTAKYDLTLYVLEREKDLVVTFEYNTDLFELSTIRRMSEQYLCLLKEVVKNIHRPISEINILTEEEQQKLSKWNSTDLDYPKEYCIHHIFETQVEQTPDSIAIEFKDQHITYIVLNNRANQLAHYLKKLKVGPEVLVGIYLDRSIDMVVSLLGVLKSGGAYVPLDPSFPDERIAYMIKDAGVSVLLTHQNLLEKLPENQARVVCLDRDCLQIAKENSDNPDSGCTPQNIAYVIYTSGSTGKPKGVAVQHASLVNFLSSMQRTPGLTAKDTMLAVTTLSFDISALEIYLPLIVGARVILADKEEASNGRRLIELLKQSEATVMQATPATWRMLLDTGWQGNDSLKMLCGGEALSRTLANELLEKGGELWNLYGPTETTVWSAVLKVEKNDGPVPIGFPIGNTKIYILDSNLQPAPLGAFGELYIGGEGLARGYLNKPELTAEKFLPDPFSKKPGARLYRTGDVARYLPDGKIEFSGRLDYQVKIRGFRIELGEIETVCLQHPDIQEAVVVPKQILENDFRLVAYIKYKSNKQLTVSELRKYLKKKLPDYMIPSLFVTMETFPLTANGKIDRKKLPVPEGMKGETGRKQVPPETPMEKLIAEIWQQVLGMNGFSVHDNFFELGGHSLLSMKVLYHIEKKLGLRINPREIMFKNLGQLAALCETQLKQLKNSPLKSRLWKQIKQTIGF